MVSVSLRIDLDPERRIGPGKIALLEGIAAAGSIAGGARQMKMSYKRAWDLVEEMNGMFGRPIVETQAGGKRGGGAALTPAGEAIVRHFRAVERAAMLAARKQMDALLAELGDA